jgi:prophage antirepressor-like protein
MCLWYDRPVNEIQLIESTFVIESVKLRHFVDEHGEPWFIAKDVCEYLDLQDVSSACQRVWEKNKGRQDVPTLGGRQAHLTVNEPGLYQLIFQSRKPEAITFQEWVFNTVLPSLRKRGFYRLRNNATAGITSPQRTTPPTRFGRQPFLDVIKARGISIQQALEAMNALAMPDVQLINTSYISQVYGRAYVRLPLATRASIWLNLPIEDLFTEASRSRVPSVPESRYQQETRQSWPEQDVTVV